MQGFPLMESCTLPMIFARMSRFQNNCRCLSSPSQPSQLPKGLESGLHSPLPPHLSILSLSLNCSLNMSRPSKLFRLVKRSFIQCLWKGHMHNGNIMFQWDCNHQRFACNAAVIVLRVCGAITTKDGWMARKFGGQLPGTQANSSVLSQSLPAALDKTNWRRFQGGGGG